MVQAEYFGDCWGITVGDNGTSGEGDKVIGVEGDTELDFDHDGITCLFSIIPCNFIPTQLTMSSEEFQLSSDSQILRAPQRSLPTNRKQH